MKLDQRAIHTALKKLEAIREEIAQKAQEGNEQIETWGEVLGDEMEKIREAAKLDIE